MQTTDLLRLYTERLESAGVSYMVTGSMACVFYGEPRLTLDVDFVIEMSADQIPALLKAFPAEEFFTPSEATLKVDVQRPQRGSFNIIHHATGFKADLYLAGRDPLQRWGFSRVQEVDVGGATVTLAPPEYVILRKLEYFREGGSEKHIRDIVGVLRKQPDLLTSEELIPRLNSLGLTPQWERVLKHLEQNH